MTSLHRIFRSPLLPVIILAVLVPVTAFGAGWGDSYGGLISDGEIRTLCVFQDKLIAGGQFTNIGGVKANGLASWNDTCWQPLGDGVNGCVYCMVEFDGKLFIGGSFDSVAGGPTAFVTCWDGSSFTPIDSGFLGWAMDFSLYQGKLVGGGLSYLRPPETNLDSLGEVYQWTGSGWNLLERDLTGSAIVLEEFRGNLVFGGNACDLSYCGETRYLMQFDGTKWSSLALSLVGTDPSYPLSDVAVLHDSLFMVGSMEVLDTMWNVSLASFDGNNWGRMKVSNGFFGYDGRLFVINDTLWAAGVRDLYGSGTGCGFGLFKRVGSTWDTLVLALDAMPRDLIEYHGRLIVAGGFTLTSDGPANQIAQFNGEKWVPLDPIASVDELRGHLLPTKISLHQNYPNPFNPSTTISYELPKPSRVVLQIVNSLGQVVRTLVNEDRPVGQNSVIWDGRNESGNPAASGIYFAILRADDSFAGKKMIMLK